MNANRLINMVLRRGMNMLMRKGFQKIGQSNSKDPKSGPNVDQRKLAKNLRTMRRFTKF